MNFGPEIPFFAALAAIVIFFGYRVYRHGGFKGAMFGARIDHTVGEVGGEKQGPLKVVLRVHALRRDDSESLIGIELVAKSLAIYQMMPITLSLPQARQLVSLLQNAVISNRRPT
jgi:hypothetical protein